MVGGPARRRKAQQSRGGPPTTDRGTDRGTDRAPPTAAPTAAGTAPPTAARVATGAVVGAAPAQCTWCMSLAIRFEKIASTAPIAIVMTAQTMNVLVGLSAVNLPIWPPTLVPTEVATNYRASIWPFAPFGASLVVAERPVGESSNSAQVCSR